MSDKKSDLIEIGGLWENDGKGGKYLSGKLGRAKLLVFPNKFKEKDSQPDYRMYVAPAPEREDSGNNDGGDDPIPF